MTRRMLINAQNPEELRVAILNGSNLENFQVEVSERGLTRGNIYRGIVSNIQPSLNASFIDYGAERDGFLSMGEIVEPAFHRKAEGRPHIERTMERGKPVLVQVTKEPEGQKGAALTTNVSLAGRYFVFTPFDDTRGVSRKVEDEDERAKLKEQSASLKIPHGAGYIIRTNASGQTKTTLARDLSELVRAWKRIESDSKKGKGPALLMSDQDIILRAFRDYLDQAIDEVLIDDDHAFAKAEETIATFMPRSKVKLIRYSERQPLFSKFGVETQVDRIYERSVHLPSGGSIVIDRTEALTAIDVNSGKSTRAATQSETALHTNLEAASEVARQLRLRDIGGLIVVDFIDMRGPKHNRLVEKEVRDAMTMDKARSTVGKISPNGLLEINRQRIQQALHVRTHRPCPTCEGTGRIASPEMVGLNLLRRIESRATTTKLKKVRIALHPELADAFQNGRRQEIAGLEKEFGIRVEVIAASRLHRPEQEIDWIESDVKESHPAPAVEKLPVPVREKTVGLAGVPVEQRPEGEGQPGEKKKRRRRGRKNRNGQHGDEPLPAVVQPEEPQELAPEVDEVEEDFAEETGTQTAPGEPADAHADHAAGRGRKRRRRGRRNGGAAHAEPHGGTQGQTSWVWVGGEPHADIPAREPDASAPAGDFDDDEIESTEIAEAASGATDHPKPRRRRRGRRRPAHEARTDGEVAAPATSERPAEEAPAESNEAAAEAAPAEGTAKPRKARRHRGGRRRGARKVEGEAAGGAEEGAAGSVPPEPTE